MAAKSDVSAAARPRRHAVIYGGEQTHACAAKGEVKLTKQEIIEMIHRAGFEAVERDTVYNRVPAV